MLIDPRHLEQLAVIVEEGTLQLAAEKLGTSQPALSRMIANLELRTGMTLFERTTRPLTPTAIGLELSQQGKAIRSARLRAAEMVDFGARGFFGVLKLGAPPFLCKSLMTEAIADFLSERPNIRIDLIPDYRAGLMEKLYHNQIDVIVGPSKFAEQGNTELTLERLFSDSNVVVGRKGHPLTAVESRTSVDLQGYTWVGHSDRSLLRSDMEDALRLLGIVAPRVAFQSESAGAVLELLTVTDFLTVLPRYALSHDGSDNLGIVPIDLPDVRHDVSAITLTQRTETKLTSDFKAHLRAKMAARGARSPERSR
ncbi:LysR family transcriptional regulator [Ruegeria sp. 2205SS24-7]|uniref:LysR family transcriptional regulator n=1 Tax=Ruegeria discodermiae TaxID=3064389 RepID=UPI0027406B21|nr:LysR family transcriptional regulator [Ruegeria sp. 2205SS24-7]MDP5220701.1 LysR family transcriptional regulator [Ruegeria sp. 2205SS24-7]